MCVPCKKVVYGKSDHSLPMSQCVCGGKGKETMINKRKLGLLERFKVERTDGSTEPGGKHENCNFFVLDLAHDKFAYPALHAYAVACKKEYPELASDLLQITAAEKVPGTTGNDQAGAAMKRDPETMEKTLSNGRIAFEAYNKDRGGLNKDGQKTPDWKDLPEEIRHAWEVGAQAVLDWSREKLPAEPVVRNEGLIATAARDLQKKSKQLSVLCQLDGISDAQIAQCTKEWLGAREYLLRVTGRD